MAFCYDSDSSDGSDFSGFGESDIEVPLEHESENEFSSDDDEPARVDGWTQNYSNLRVCSHYNFFLIFLTFSFFFYLGFPGDFT